MSPIGMTALLVSTLAFFAWSARRRWRQLMLGTSTERFRLDGGEFGARIRDTLVYAFGQKKMPYYRVAGIAHMLIFAGFMVLLLRSVVLWGRGFDPSFDLFGLLGAGTLLGDAYSLIKDIFALLVLLGSSVFVWLRVVRRSPRMTLGWEGLMILGIIMTMMLADFLYDGASMVLESRSQGHALHFRTFEPAGSALAFLLQGVESETMLQLLQHVGFWWHSAFVLIFLNILPYSKHFHIITAIPNVFTRDRNPAGQLPNIEDLEGKVEREEAIGISKLQDLTWKHILDLYTCTECGRCSDNCPAFITDKKLSPKHLTLALRDHLYDTEYAFFGEGRGQKGITPGEELDTHPRAPAGGYFRSPKPEELVPNIVHPDVIWACTSCRACEEQCPVMISYVDKIVGMRRHEVLMKNEFPAELSKPFNGMETNGNPWNLSSMDRGNWSDGLEVPFLTDHSDAAVLYWVGCAASYDDRAKRIARSVAQLLKHAGVDFAILGSEENCTGDPARRAGNEYLFQMLAQQNVETLNKYGVDKKTIVTACPHCFNTLAREYPDFGGKYEVVHHTDFLMGLIARGKIVPRNPVRGRVVYHDSCYLGRYNDVYESPRQVLESIPGVELVEVPEWNRRKGLCCGAGGSQMWMEEQNQNRVNRKRTLQILQTAPTTVASACPFCMTMLTDGLKAEEKEDEIAQLDIAEILWASIAPQATVAPLPPAQNSASAPPSMH